MSSNKVEATEEAPTHEETSLSMEPHQTKHDMSNTSKPSNRRVCIYILAFVFVALAALSIVGIYFMVEAQNQSDGYEVGTFSTPGKSCLELKKQGIMKSGYYVIEPENVNSPFRVYCDMETADGGWTLVANIHNEQSNFTCPTGDLWSSASLWLASRNWENKYTFGDAKMATSSDYKNPGYFSMKAADVMFRHVPSNYSTLDSKAETSLQYHTTNKFLEDYGGNLFSLYTEHYPLTPDSSPATVSGPSIVEDILDVLANSSSKIFDISSSIPELYQYVYDDVNPSRLTNGGRDLFDPYGMEVTANTPRCSETLVYGRSYSCPEVSSRKTYPFFALMNVEGNIAPNTFNYTIKSYSTSHESTKRAYSSVPTSGNYGMTYYANCRYSQNNTSFCDLMFTVFNRKDWNSTAVFSSTSYSTNVFHGATFNNSVYGYTMVARSPSNVDVDIPVNLIFSKILDVIAQFPDRDINQMLDGLVANSDHILDLNPPEFYRYVYDDIRPDRLTNGGRNMFSPYGMEVTALPAEGDDFVIEYGKSYRLSEGWIELSSRKSYPFFALMKLENTNLTVSSGFKVSSGLTFGEKPATHGVHSNTLRRGNFRMAFDAECHYSNDTKPSICDVIFNVHNEKEWNSKEIKPIPASKVTLLNKNISDTEYTFRESETRAAYTNSLLGYTLLARDAGSTDIPFQLGTIMENILDIIAQFPVIAPACANPSNNLVVPIKYTVGSVVSMENRIPRSFQPLVSLSPDIARQIMDGYLQFRARTRSGATFAICPAVKVMSCQPRHVCIGGVRSRFDEPEDCSKYLDWPPTESTVADRHGSSDIRSNIMIFYR